MNNMHAFDLNVDPYDFLGVKRGCKDLKEIKKAYRKKALQFHPDKRQGNDYDFSTLNKCYIYIKTLCQELYGRESYGSENYGSDYGGNGGSRHGSMYNSNGGGANDTYMTDLEKRMRDLQQARIETEQDYERKRKINTVPQHNVPMTQKGKINFEQQLKYDNAIIDDEFDADAAYNDMMTHRPSSTSYTNLETPAIENPFRNRKFNLDQFNKHFMEKMSSSQSENDNLDGFSGFDDISGAASIVSDGSF